MISEHWYWFNEIITKWHTLKTHIFHSDRCNKTSPRCFDSAAEEVWVQLQLHVLLQNQLFCGGSLQPANTGGIYKVYFNIWSKIIFIFLSHFVIFCPLWSEWGVRAVCSCGSFWWSERRPLQRNNQNPGWRQMV